MRRIRPLSPLLAVMGLLAHPILGDAIAYQGVKDLRAESAELVAIHHHDWSEPTWKKRSRMMMTHQDPFTPENDYAYVSVKRKDTGALLFKSPSPALTWLGVTARSRYVIGLSDIMMDNPYHVVVWDRTGRVVGKYRVGAGASVLTAEEYRRLRSRYAKEFQVLHGQVCSRDGNVYIDFERLNLPANLGDLWGQLTAHRRNSPITPSARESVSNWVHWYSAAAPDPEVMEKAGKPVALRVTDRIGKRITIPLDCDRPQAS